MGVNVWFRRCCVGLVVLACAVAGVSCGDDDEGSTTDGTADPLDSAPEATDSSTSSTEDPGTTADTSSSTTVVDGIDPLEGASTDAVIGDGTTEYVSCLLDVRVARQEGYDRVVFEFENDIPSYEIRYGTGPVIEDPTGEELAVEGNFFLAVRFFPSRTFDTETGEPTYDGPDRVDGDTAEVTEVVLAGDFEAVLNWVIGVVDQQDYRVTEMTSPDRLVIDIRNH